MPGIPLLLALFLLVGPATGVADEHSHGHGIGDIEVHDVVMPLPPGPARTAAVYLTLVNTGRIDDRLKGVASRLAANAMVHQTVVEDDIARMRHAVNGIAVPAGQHIRLEPGGYHIMLMDLATRPKVGERVEMTLEFDRAGPMTLKVPVVARGESPDHDHRGSSSAK